MKYTTLQNYFWSRGLISHTYLRNVTTRATGTTEIAPIFSDTFTLLQPGGHILPTIPEIAPIIFPWIHLWSLLTKHKQVATHTCEKYSVCYVTSKISKWLSNKPGECLQASSIADIVQHMWDQLSACQKDAHRDEIEKNFKPASKMNEFDNSSPEA